MNLFFRPKSAPTQAVDIAVLRVIQTLESSASCFMIADADRKIVYANKAVQSMLKAVERDIQQELPHFSADNLVGSNIDGFHKKPQHQQLMLSRLTKPHTAQIVVGGRSFKLVLTPLFSQEGSAIGTSVEWQDLTELKISQRRIDQVISALDGTSTNVMIADENRTIIYMNKSVESMLRSVESELQRVLPHFSVDKVVGSSMDIFHKNPAHQAVLLERLQQRYESQISVAGLHFRLIANPIKATDGQRLGTVVEWADRTKEVNAENEINRVVDSAARGDFTVRVEEQGKSGFLLALARGLNSLMQTADTSLKDISTVLQTVASGDLTKRVEVNYEGTFETLKNGCNTTAINLSQMLEDIRIAVDTINNAASEISSGNSDLSGRTEQQASSLEQTAASIEELTGTVKQNADNAKNGYQLAAKASEIAVVSGTLNDQVVATMGAINESARKIADIIGVIDGIAFQTNILALNAAVEAARAGEQGRGFAVVASEVRTLAQRSANAAKDIKSLISDSVRRIDTGNELVIKSGDTMREVVNAIKRVNEFMADIATASVEQATGIAEVNQAIALMDDTTQQNAALVEQAAASAESLLEQAEQLQELVARFKIDGHANLDGSTRHVLKRPAVKSNAIKQQPQWKPVKNTKPSSMNNSDQDEWDSF